jgi:hypothetical protein
MVKEELDLGTGEEEKPTSKNMGRRGRRINEKQETE